MVDATIPQGASQTLCHGQASSWDGHPTTPTSWCRQDEQQAGILPQAWDCPAPSHQLSMPRSMGGDTFIWERYGLPSITKAAFPAPTSSGRQVRHSRATATISSGAASMIDLSSVDVPSSTQMLLDNLVNRAGACEPLVTVPSQCITMADCPKIGYCLVHRCVRADGKSVRKELVMASLCVYFLKESLHFGTPVLAISLERNAMEYSFACGTHTKMLYSAARTH